MLASHLYFYRQEPPPPWIIYQMRQAGEANQTSNGESLKKNSVKYGLPWLSNVIVSFFYIILKPEKFRPAVLKPLHTTKIHTPRYIPNCCTFATNQYGVSPFSYNYPFKSSCFLKTAHHHFVQPR